MHTRRRSIIWDLAAVLGVFFIFILPFSFVVINAGKSQHDSFVNLSFKWPEKWVIWSNFKELWANQDHLLLHATINTLLITVLSVSLLIFVSSIAGFYIQRQSNTRLARFSNLAILVALIAPPAVVPTIWVMQEFHIYGGLLGIVLIEVTYSMAFSMLLFRNFMASIPRELDEAAIVDGCSGWRLYFRIIFPLQRPVTITLIIVTSVVVFNDFANPLYFIPGNQNATLQLTLYSFLTQLATNWNLIFTDILYITIIPLIVFIFFNRKIVEGMTAGSVKG